MRLLLLLVAVVAVTHQYDVQLNCENNGETMKVTARTFEGFTIVDIENKAYCKVTVNYGKAYVALKELSKSDNSNGVLTVRERQKETKIREKESWQCDSTCDGLIIVPTTQIKKLVFAVADEPNFNDKPNIPFAEYNPGPGKSYPCDSPASSGKASGCRLKASFDFIIHKFENEKSCRTLNDRKELGFPVRRIGTNSMWEWIAYKSCIQAQVIGEAIEEITVDPFHGRTIAVGEHRQFTQISSAKEGVPFKAINFDSQYSNSKSGLSTRKASDKKDSKFNEEPQFPGSRGSSNYNVEEAVYVNIKWPLNQFSAKIRGSVSDMTHRRAYCVRQCQFTPQTATEQSKQMYQIFTVPSVYKVPWEDDYGFPVIVDDLGETSSVRVTTKSCSDDDLKHSSIQIAYNELVEANVCATLSHYDNGRINPIDKTIDCLAEETLHIAVHRQQCFDINITPAKYSYIYVDTRMKFVFKPNPPGHPGLYRLPRSNWRWLFGSMEVDWKGCQKDDRAIWITDHRRFILRRNSSNFAVTKPARIFAEFYNGREYDFYTSTHDWIRVALPVNCPNAVVTLLPFMKLKEVVTVPWVTMDKLWDEMQVDPISVILNPHEQYTFSKGARIHVKEFDAYQECNAEDELLIYGLTKREKSHDDLLKRVTFGELMRKDDVLKFNLDAWAFVMFETTKPNCFVIKGEEIKDVTGTIQVSLDDWLDSKAGGFNIRTLPQVKSHINVLKVVPPLGYSFAKVKITFEDCEDRLKRAQVQGTNIETYSKVTTINSNKDLIIKFYGSECVNAIVIAPDRESQAIQLIPIPAIGVHTLALTNEAKIIEVHAEPEDSLFKRFEVIRDKNCKDPAPDKPIQAWYGIANDNLGNGEKIRDTDVSVKSGYSLLSTVIFKLPKDKCYSVNMISNYETQIQEHLTFTNVTIKSPKDSASIRVTAKDHEGQYWGKVQVAWNDKAECVAKKKTAFLHLDLFSGDKTVKLQHLQGSTGIKNDFPITVGHELQVVSNAFECYTIKLISSWEFAPVLGSPFEKIDLVEIQSKQYPNKNVLFEVTSNIADYFWYTMNIQGTGQKCKKEDTLYFGVFAFNEKDGFERMREFKCGYTDVKDALFGDGRSSKIRVALYYKEDTVFAVFLEPKETKKVLDDSTPYEVVDVPPTEEGMDQTIIISWTHGGTWKEFAFVNVAGRDCNGVAAEIKSIKWTPENKKKTGSFEEFEDVQNWDEKQLSANRFTPSSLEGYKVTIHNGCMKLQKQSAPVKKHENLNPLENSKQLTADNNNGNVLDINVEGKAKFAAINVNFDNCPNTENLNYEVHIINKYKKTIVALKEGQKSQTTTSSGKAHSYHHTFRIGVPDPCAKVQMVSFTDPSYTTNATWDPNQIQRHTGGPGNVVFNVVKQPDGISSEFESMTISGLPLGEKCDKDAMIFITTDGKTPQKIKYSDVEKSSKSINGAGKKISILTPNDCFKVMAIPKKEPITKVLGLYVNSNDFIADRPQLLTIKSDPSAQVFEGLWDRFTVESNEHYADIEECQGKTLKFVKTEAYNPIGTFNALKDNEYKYGDNATTYKYLSTKDFVIDVDNQCFKVTAFSGGALEKLDINPDSIQGVSNKQSVPKYIYLKSTTGKSLGKSKLKKVSRKAAKSINALDYENTCPRSQIEVGGKTYRAIDIPEKGTDLTIDTPDTLLKMDSPCIQLLFGELDKNATKCLIPLKLAYKNEFTKSSTCEGKTVPRKFVKPPLPEKGELRRFEPKLEISKNEKATGCTPSSGMYIYLEGNRDDEREEPIRYSDVENGPYADFYPKHVDPTNFVFYLQDDCLKITFIDEDLYEGYSNDIPDKEDNSPLLLATIILWCLFVVACITFAIIFFKTLPPMIGSGGQGAPMDSIIL